jgi:ubiquitin-protein ligase E3 A
MFKLCKESNLYWFDGNSLEPPLTFELVGTIMGMALYNDGSPCGPEKIPISTNIEVPLAPVIYKLLMGGKPTVFDYSMYDPELY